MYCTWKLELEIFLILKLEFFLLKGQHSLYLCCVKPIKTHQKLSEISSSMVSWVQKM
jgi:hypothetical protein